MWEMRHREGKFPVQGHTVSKRCSWGAHPQAAGSQVQATDHSLPSRKVPAPINRIKGLNSHNPINRYSKSISAKTIKRLEEHTGVDLYDLGSDMVS